MSFRKLFTTGALALTLSVVGPAKASADWLFTPFIGGTFGGSANVTDFDLDEDFEDEFNRKLTYGASLAYLGGGIAGFELDFGYSPNFFETDDEDSLNLVGDGNVTTLMANVILSIPAGPVRPYFVAGGGLIKTRVDGFDQFFTDIDSNNFGFDVGGGVMAMFSENVGIRGDLRYFRSVNKDDDDIDLDSLSLGDFKFWRGTVGITLKF
jgi:opacity protein-like surface antigen